MLEDVVIEPMTESFILWRCLHRGPQSGETINQWPPDEAAAWEGHRDINLPLLSKIIRTYGTCAMLARDGHRIVGFLRFYPQVLFSMEGAGQLCLQQAHPAGPSEDLVSQRFPRLSEIEDKTLMVHCLMTGSPSQEENPYQRKGIGTRMARQLVSWAKENGWKRIEANAYRDIDILYAITGDAGTRFWEKLGFHMVRAEAEPGFKGELLDTLLGQARAQGLSAEDAVMRYTMQLELA